VKKSRDKVGNKGRKKRKEDIVEGVFREEECIKAAENMRMLNQPLIISY